MSSDLTMTFEHPAGMRLRFVSTLMSASGEGGFDPGVPRGRDAGWTIVSHDPNVRIGERSDDVARSVPRPVIHHDDLEIDVALTQDGADRVHREIASIVCRDHHGDERSHASAPL